MAATSINVNACENCMYWRRHKYFKKDGAQRSDTLGSCHRLSKELDYQFCYIGTDALKDKDGEYRPINIITIQHGVCKFHKHVNELS